MKRWQDRFNGLSTLQDALIMNIVHIVEGKEFGGVYTALKNLILHTEGRMLKGNVIRNQVVSLENRGLICDHLAAEGIPVAQLSIYRFPDGPVSGFVRLARLIRRSRPVIVNAWFSRSNLLSGLAVRLAGCPPLVWQFHTSAPISTKKDMPRALRGLPVRLCGPLSHHIPDAVVYVADTPCRSFGAAGFHVHDKAHVIYNGIDCDRFHPDSQARSSVRRELNLADDCMLIGFTANFSPLKDHNLFLNALARLESRNAHAVLCGVGTDPGNADIVHMVNRAGVADRVHLLGVREDMPRLIASWDVAVNSSWAGGESVPTEAHPIAICEALTTGVPCVTTDIGDITKAVALAGHVVHSRNPDDLAAAIDSVLALSPQERMTLGQRGRQYAAENYSMEAYIQKWMTLYEVLASGKESGSRSS